jgi:multiple sugar transport system permease protein
MDALRMNWIKKHRAKIAIYVFLALGSIVMVTPFLYTLSRSLHNSQQIFAFPFEWIPDPFVWSNYSEAYSKFGTRTFLNSALLTLIVVVGQSTLGMMAGFAFSTLRFPLRDSLFVLLIAGLLVPFQVIMIPLFMFIYRIGWLDTYWGLVIPIVAYTDVAIFMFRQFFRTVPRELYEAAVMDGAGPIRVFRSVYAPLARSTLVAFTIVSALAAWNLYAWPFLAVSDPDLRLVTLQLGISGGTFNTGAGALRPELLSTMSLMGMIPIIAVFIFMQRRFVEGMARSGITG